VGVLRYSLFLRYIAEPPFFSTTDPQGHSHGGGDDPVHSPQVQWDRCEMPALQSLHRLAEGSSRTPSERVRETHRSLHEWGLRCQRAGEGDVGGSLSRLHQVQDLLQLLQATGARGTCVRVYNEAGDRRYAYFQLAYNTTLLSLYNYFFC